MINLIATDLDDTLLNTESRLSSTNREALELAIRNGIEVVIATGRGLSGIPQDLLDVQGIRYAITSNGACIYNIRTGEILRHYTIPATEVKKLVKIGFDNRAAYEIFVGGKAYVSQEYYDDPAAYGMPENRVGYIHSTRIPVEDIDMFIKEHDSEIENFAFVVNSWSVHDRVAIAIKNTCINVFVTSTDMQWVEVMSSECGKGKGLKHLCEYLDVDFVNVAAFGDGDNDVDMMEFAGMSFCVENGSAACKQAADHIVSSNECDGVSRAIKEFILK